MKWNVLWKRCVYVGEILHVALCLIWNWTLLTPSKFIVLMGVFWDFQTSLILMVACYFLQYLSPQQHLVHLIGSLPNSTSDSLDPSCIIHPHRRWCNGKTETYRCCTRFCYTFHYLWRDNRHLDKCKSLNFSLFWLFVVQHFICSTWAMLVLLCCPGECSCCASSVLPAVENSLCRGQRYLSCESRTALLEAAQWSKRTRSRVQGSVPGQPLAHSVPHWYPLASWCLFTTSSASRWRILWPTKICLRDVGWRILKVCSFSRKRLHKALQWTVCTHASALYYYVFSLVIVCVVSGCCSELSFLHYFYWLEWLLTDSSYCTDKCSWVLQKIVPWSKSWQVH